MNRRQYLNQLKHHLKGFPQDELQDIIMDYEEHFDVGVSKGKTEEEISMELGNPKDIAQNFKNTYSSSAYDSDNYKNEDISYKSSHSSRNILSIIMLMFFNVVIAFGVFIALVAVLFSSYGVGLSFIVSGFIILLGSPISVFITITSPHILTSLSFGIGFISLGILGILLSVYLTKGFIKFIGRYLRWNMRIINGEEAM